MNNCDLCGKEGLTEFTVKSKHLRWILSEDLQKLDTHKNNWLTKNICEDCFKKIFDKSEEDCESELPEPFGEKHYKAFEDTAELMVHYSKHFNIDFPPFYEPLIWVKRKDNDSRFLITGYDELDVFLEDCWQDLNDLYEQYVFLDGSCIGKEE